MRINNWQLFVNRVIYGVVKEEELNEKEDYNHRTEKKDG